MNYIELIDNIKEYLIFELQILEGDYLESIENVNSVINLLHERYYRLLKDIPLDDLNIMLKAGYRMCVVDFDTLHYLNTTYTLSVNKTNPKDRCINKLLIYTFMATLQDTSIHTLRILRDGF